MNNNEPFIHTSTIDEPFIHTSTIDEFNSMSQAEKLAFVTAGGVLLQDREPLKAFLLQLSKKAPRKTKWDTILINGVMPVKEYATMLASGNPDLYTAKNIEKAILKSMGIAPSIRQILRWIK